MLLTRHYSPLVLQHCHRSCSIRKHVCAARRHRGSIINHEREEQATRQHSLHAHLHWLQKSLAKALASAACLGVLLQAPVQAEELSIAFPASPNEEIRRAQQTLVESWAYVQALYLDPSFSHQDWTKALQDSLAQSFKARGPSEVTDITNKLLATLGDPYTRLLQGEDAAALAAEEQGKIVATGLGLQPVVLSGLVSNPPYDPAATSPPDNNQQDQQEYQINPQPLMAMAAATGTTATPNTQSTSSNNSSMAATAAKEVGVGDGPQVLVVSFVVEGSPAESAGVQEGDVLLEVQGEPVAGKQLRQVYKLLSKESDVTLLRQPELTSWTSNVAADSNSSSSSTSPVLPMTQLSPADAARNNSSSSSSNGRQFSAADLLPGYSPERVYTVHLKPEVMEFEPVQYGIIDLHKDSSSSSSSGLQDSSSSAAQQVGYLKILTFSASAPQQVAEALIDMQQLQPKSQQQSTPDQQQQQLSGIILDLRDNPGGVVEAGVDVAVDFLHEGQVLCIAVDKSGEEDRVVLPSAHTLTNLPLVLLVNKNTASTSELVAGALHDELAAPLIGTTTYGKGRTQRVMQLSDNTSTLLVSTMKYFTPKHTEIDHVGLKPDVVCDPPVVTGQRWMGGKQGQDKVSLLDDPCIKMAAEKLADLASAEGAVAN